eukprot:TRINITY_DN1310_c0_g1_i1.p1 TRINITY_DN1310_c0_g1~~TRINITY_DN1310_c0_g1_i1.p1  ORF type:complete len:301 (+),score=57.48 TRINITY_DN1310_c0_g1_i1:124-1026(+)
MQNPVNDIRHKIFDVYKSGVEAVFSPLSTSQFEEKRVLTPEEFLKAGDYLVSACPTWQWEGGEEKKRRSFFPDNKQYLVTRQVPCPRRAAAMEAFGSTGVEGDDDWIQAGTGDQAKKEEKEEILDLTSQESENKATGASSSKQQADDDDIPDLDDLAIQDDDVEQIDEDDFVQADFGEDNILKTRTYDLFITYDQYYQVPRFWLVGYDENKNLLNKSQLLQDISEEHAKKTVTMEPHPNLSMSCCSIHPCKHSNVMKKLGDSVVESGREFKLEHYMLTFLKFVSSIVPTIEYDYTMSGAE